MKFSELAIGDKLYLQELSHLYRSLLGCFVLVFYGLSSIAIFMPHGQALIDAVAGILPETMSRQAEALRALDGDSHASYLVGIPTIIALGTYFSFKARAMTITLHERHRGYSQIVTTPRYESMALAGLLIVLLLVVFHSGTISTGSRGPKTSGLLLWPMCGLVYFSATAILVTAVNSFVVLLNFGPKRN